MTDEFPKNRGGWSGPGRTAARSLASEGDERLTWGRKRRFGAEARNKGGHLTVKVEQQGLAGFASLGVESGSTVMRSSDTARGTFSQTTPTPASALVLDQLLSRGNGSAYSIGAVTSLGLVASIFSSGNESYSIGSFIARTGAAAVDRPAIVHKGPWDGSTIDRAVNVWPTIGARFENGYEHAMAYASIDGDGQHIVAVTFDNGEAQRTVTAFKVPDQMTFPLAFDRVGPGAFLGMAGTYLWRGATPGWYDQTAAPGFVFFGSIDNGATWFTFPAPAFTVHEQAQYLACALNGTTDRLRYNQSMDLTAATIVPLSRTRALVYARLGSPDEIPEVGGRFENSRVRVGVADLLAQTVSLTDTLYEPPFIGTNLLNNRRTLWRWERGACMAPGGGALVFFNDADYPANWTSNPQVHYTEDGAALALLGAMSVVAGRAGTPAALSRNKLLMPVYDGTDHALFESTDKALTWQRRATISTLATETLPGTTDSRTGPRSFNNIAWLRNNGRPQGATPSAPWLSDDRITPP